MAVVTAVEFFCRRCEAVSGTWSSHSRAAFGCERQHLVEPLRHRHHQRCVPV